MTANTNGKSTYRGSFPDNSTNQIKYENIPNINTKSQNLPKIGNYVTPKVV